MSSVVFCYLLTAVFGNAIIKPVEDARCHRVAGETSFLYRQVTEDKEMAIFYFAEVYYGLDIIDHCWSV